MHESIVISSRAMLVRNYADLPFDVGGKPEMASAVISRTSAALRSQGFSLHLLSGMTEENRRVLLERERVSPGMLRHPDQAALLLPEEGPVCVMLGGGCHVRILSERPGSALAETLADCLAVEDVLSRRVSFAFDKQLGYLAADEMQLGTGLRVFIRLHLPMLTRSNRMGVLMKIAESKGCMLLGPTVQQKTPPGDLWILCNRRAIGMTEREICGQVEGVMKEIARMEEELRQQIMQEQEVLRFDRIWRAWGILQNARLLALEEFQHFWSDARLGAELALLPVTGGKLDEIWREAMNAHLCSYAEESLTGVALDECRASRVRGMLEEIPLE